MEILTLGEKIKKRRKELNMTLKNLGGDRVTPGQISLVESGKSKPSMELLQYLAQKLDVSVDYLFETEEKQAEKLCDYYSKISNASILACNYEQAQGAVSQGMGYANQYNLQYYKGLDELYNGKIQYGLKNYEEAQAHFIAANEVFFKLEKYRDIVETYIGLGMVSYKLLYFNSSLNYYKQAEKVLTDRKILDDGLLTRIYFDISLCYSRLNMYSNTIDYSLLAMNKFKERDDKFQYGQTLLMLSISYNSLNKFDEALMYADMAIKVFKELDDLTFIAKMETNMGIILADIGEIDDSFTHLKNSYRIKLDTRDKTIAYTMLRIADNYIKTNEVDKAEDMINQAYKKCMEDDNREYLITVYYYLYRVCCLKKDISNAERYLLEAVDYLKNLDMPKELADIYIMLGEFYDSQGKKDSALEYINKGIGIYKDLGLILIKRSW